MKRAICILLVFVIILLPPVSVRAADAKAFRGEVVTELYSYDLANRSYHPVEGADREAVLQLLEDWTPKGRQKAAEAPWGFLVISQSKRYYFPLSDSSGESVATRLVEMARACSTGTPAIAQVFGGIHPDGVERITFGGMAGGGYSQIPGSPEALVGLDTRDSRTIRTVLGYLRTVPVQAEPKVYDELLNYTMPLGRYVLTLYLSGGERRVITGLDDGMTVLYPGEPGMSIDYGCEEAHIQALRDFVRALPESEENPL